MIGFGIKNIQKCIEYFAKDNSTLLSIGGALLTFLIIFLSGLSGWVLERLIFHDSLILKALGSLLVCLSLASTLAYTSLKKSVLEVLKFINNDSRGLYNIQYARKELSQIVGRDVTRLNQQEILRALAETASENSVDGIFAPLFWMFIGTLLWKISLIYPGPLAFALIFKASSTLDSMVGYKQGRLKWIGFSGAKLDDLMTWIPCRLVLISLPLLTQPLRKIPQKINIALQDGSKDLSPNSGISEAIYAHCTQIQMGGANFYNGNLIFKPIIAANYPEPSPQSIKKILKYTFNLEIMWLGIILLLNLIFYI